MVLGRPLGDRQSRRRRIPEVLELVGLSTRGADRVGAFSKGMQQRIGLAQALITRPDLVMLDEPTSALDPIGRRDVRALIQQLKSEGTAVFLNSHLLSEVEMVCDRVGIVNHGRVIRQGRVEDLLSRQQELEIRADGLTAALLAQLPERWRVIESAGQHLVLAVPAASDAADVARLLVGRGADLFELRPHRSNLEEFFVELVEGEDHASVDFRPADAAGSLA